MGRPAFRAGLRKEAIGTPFLLDRHLGEQEPARPVRLDDQPVEPDADLVGALRSPAKALGQRKDRELQQEPVQLGQSDRRETGVVLGGGPRRPGDRTAEREDREREPHTASQGSVTMARERDEHTPTLFEPSR